MKSKEQSLSFTSGTRPLQWPEAWHLYNDYAEDHGKKAYAFDPFVSRPTCTAYSRNEGSTLNISHSGPSMTILRTPSKFPLPVHFLYDV